MRIYLFRHSQHILLNQSEKDEHAHVDGDLGLYARPHASMLEVLVDSHGVCERV